MSRTVWIRLHRYAKRTEAAHSPPMGQGRSLIRWDRSRGHITIAAATLFRLDAVDDVTADPDSVSPTVVDIDPV